MADHIDGALPHLAQRDLTFLAVSLAPLALPPPAGYSRLRTAFASVKGGRS